MPFRLSFFLLSALSLTLFLQSPLFAQLPVYESFAVDSIAVPLGGSSMLETFLSVNLQKPFMAQVANATGKVFIKAVVEPNGHLSDVTVLRGFRPDCDREAVRAMRLFNAWKPAMKGGRAVKQAVTYTVSFYANKPVNYKDGKVINFFDANRKAINGIKNAKYITEMFIDIATGKPNGDLVTYELYYGKWDEKNRVPVLKEELKNQGADEIAYWIGYKLNGIDWSGPRYGIRADGSVAYEEIFSAEGPLDIAYFRSGAVKSFTIYNEKKTIEWHSNGMVYRTIVDVKDKYGSLDTYRLTNAWDSTGLQLVRKGAGHIQYTSLIQSQLDSTSKILLVEEGTYFDGLRHGIWKGSTADGSFMYEERFDKGYELGGKAVRNGKLINYTSAIQRPDFIGGSEELQKFLKSNLIYPADARRSLISGTVLLSFTILPNGSLVNFYVKKSVDPSLDEEALRVAKKTDGHWKAGFYRGEPSSMAYDLPIWFMLEKQKPTDLINAAGGFYRFYPFGR